MTNALTPEPVSGVPGGCAALKAAGLEVFRADLARLLPEGAPLEALGSWDDVRVLSVRWTG
jgi:hypothetical protein